MIWQFMVQHRKEILERTLEHLWLVTAAMTRAIVIGLIHEALEDNDARPIKSLKKCPHPHKRYGIEMADLLELIESVLLEE